MSKSILSFLFFKSEWQEAQDYIYKQNEQQSEQQEDKKHGLYV